MENKTTLTAAIDTYKALRAAGERTTTACYTMMRDHGMSGDDVISLSWHVETGGPAPIFVHADGSPTAAAMRWTAAKDRAAGAE